MMTNGLEKEYDLSLNEVEMFLNWYDAKDAGNGLARYPFVKSPASGAFSSQTEYVIFDKILAIYIDVYATT